MRTPLGDFSEPTLTLFQQSDCHCIEISQVIFRLRVNTLQLVVITEIDVCTPDPRHAAISHASRTGSLTGMSPNFGSP